MAASFEIFARKLRTTDWTISLYESNGTAAIVLAATDVVRVKVGRGDNATPNLDIDSVGATANGSQVSIVTLSPGVVTLRIAQGDLPATFAPGVYDVEILVVDDSETTPDNAIKHAQNGVLHVLESMAGDVGLS